MTKPTSLRAGDHATLPAAQVLSALKEALPSGTYYCNGSELTWTTSSGVWRVNYVELEEYVKARIEQSRHLAISVPSSRRGLSAMFRFLVAMGAIAAHPDDPREA